VRGTSRAFISAGHRNVRRMKGIPPLSAIFTGIFLTICLLQLRGRGMGFAPSITDWELHPAWWHFNFLADCAEYLVNWPAFFIILLEVWTAELFGIQGILPGPVFFQVIMGWVPFVLPIVVESLMVFYISRAVTFRIWRNHVIRTKP
jgi:hypothetical protein